MTSKFRSIFAQQSERGTASVGRAFTLTLTICLAVAGVGIVAAGAAQQRQGNQNCPSPSASAASPSASPSASPTPCPTTPAASGSVSPTGTATTSPSGSPTQTGSPTATQTGGSPNPTVTSTSTSTTTVTTSPTATSTSTSTTSPDPTQTPTRPACSDGLDNDGDTRVDFPADPGCTSPDDHREANGSGGGNGDRRRFVNSRVSINHRFSPVHKFHGKVRSRLDNCEDNRVVIVRRVTKGRDDFVGKDRTNRRGKWNHPHTALPSDRYYAIARPKRFTNNNGRTIVCERDRSRTLFVTS